MSKILKNYDNFFTEKLESDENSVFSRCRGVMRSVTLKNLYPFHTENETIYVQ